MSAVQPPSYTLPETFLTFPATYTIDGTDYVMSSSVRPNFYLYPWFDTGEIQSLRDYMQAGLTDVAVYLINYINSFPPGGGAGSVTSVGVVAPLTLSGNSNIDPVIGIPSATGSRDGYLTQTNWNTFNSKQALLVNQVNIKSINGESLLGSGDIVITGGGGATVTVDANEGLTVVGSALGTVYNTLIADSVNSIAVGGAPSLPASTWKTKNIVEALDTILFPDVLPTYTIPTITTTTTISGTREIGETISPLITTLGSENDSGAFTSIRTYRNAGVVNTNASPTMAVITDIPPQFGYVDPNNPNRSYTALFTDTNFVIPSGNTTWSGRGDYAAGLAKKNNKNVTDTRPAQVRSVNAPQSASTDFTAATVTITGIYPYFYGKSLSQPTPASIAAAIQAGTATKVLSSSTGTVTVTYNAAGEYVWVAIPAVSTVKTSWYNTSLNNGPIGAGEFILSPVLQNVTAPNAFWSAVSFNVYISGYATTTSGSIEYRN